MYDVFISYRRDGGYEMARLIYEHLKNNGLSPFFDVEELRSGPFNTELYNVIEESENFLLILPPNALDRCQNKNDWLRLEIEHAIKFNKNIIPVMMKNFEWPTNLPKSIEVISKYNGLEMSREYFNASIKKILSLMINVNIPSKNASSTNAVIKRTNNTYFNSENIKELKRLKIQQELLENFDKDTYNKTFKSFDHIALLDIGCNDGSMIMNKIKDYDNIDIVIGIDYDYEIVNYANKKYNDNKGYFYQMNIEDDNLTDKLEEILHTHNIEKFNVINMSMILLHLQNPFKLLKQIRKFFSDDGIIIIRDIDDGLNFAYPDDDNYFKRAINICDINETSGYRKTGRQIYTLLKRTGYTNINLEKSGLSTIGMSFDQKEALFETYFSFIGDDCKLMVDKYPNEIVFLDNYNWYKSIYDTLEEKFLDDTFVFSLGLMLFTATKK